MKLGPPVRIRAATPADLPSLRRLGALLVSMHHDLDPNRFLTATMETERAYGSLLVRQLADPDVAIIVAEVEGETVGYASGALEGYDYLALLGPAGILYDLVVDPPSRGRGIGRMLLAAIMTELGARGAPRVLLSRAVHNEPAQRLFARAGFRATMIEMTCELDSTVASSLAG